jgi:4-hydroxythreonine-4-phosphate dehydrogenase
MPSKPILAVTQGDPCGIGPELVLKACALPTVTDVCVPLVIGDRSVLRAAANALDLPMPATVLAADACTRADWTPPGDAPLILDCGQLSRPLEPGHVTAAAGRAAHAYLLTALDLVRTGRAAALTTCPLSKAALHLAGIHAQGHTEILAQATGTRRFAMMQYSRRLVVTFATCHQSLASVPAALTVERIADVVALTAATLRRLRGAAPRLAVLGLNPHNGEEGAFGSEEAVIIEPAVTVCRERGYDVAGPLPPDAAFMPHNLQRYDAFVCMYHDQGHIPFKMVAVHEGVNVTMGLPVIRTSVDHGTAFDIAGRGVADPGSLTAALRLAVQLAPGRDGARAANA